MKKFKLVIEETLSKEINIEADNMKDAMKKVRQQYDAGKIVLTADDFVAVEFKFEEE